LANLRVLRLASALGSNTVSGIALKLGVRWPPPPIISVRNLFKLAGGEVNALVWLPANPFAILIDPAQDIWHAGHVNDVLALDSGGIVVGTASGGVWLIEANDNAVPLTDDKDQPGITSLAFGPNGPLHIFAGGDGLFETDTSTSVPLFNWRPVPLTPVRPGGMSIGSINRLVVLKQRRQIVLACSNGVFWSPIPTSGDVYNWQQLPNLPQGQYSGLAVGPNDRIVIAAWPAGSDPIQLSLYGIFYADWFADSLGATFRATLPSSQPGQNTVFGLGMGRTSLASSVQDPRVMYAVSSQLRTNNNDLTIYAVLASADGGATWTQATIPNFPVPFHQGDYNNCLGVSPFDSRVVALGWQKHFVSRDSGMTWQLFDLHAGLPALHDDVHGVYFDPTSPPNERLYVCSDGGLALTVDGGKTFAGHTNKYLLNLQFYGGDFTASFQTPGLIGGGTQDNGNLYSVVGANPSPWTYMEGGDGGLMMIVGTGQLLRYYSQQPLLRVAQWDGAHFNDNGQVSSNGLTDIPLNPIGAIVNAPLKRNAANQLMLAVAAGDSTGYGVYGIFADSQGLGMHYELLGRIPIGLGLGPVTALGSSDGSVVFVGMSGGLIYAINTGQQTISKLPIVPLQNSSEGDAGAYINRIVVVSNNLAFAILSKSQYVGGQNFILRWEGSSWNAVGVGQGLSTDQQFYALDTTPPKPLFTLFAATDKQVLESDDRGDTWQVQSGGLPARPHCSDLRFVSDPTGARFLYLGTYGRSVWRAVL
jgi:hypothetical protein